MIETLDYGFTRSGRRSPPSDGSEGSRDETKPRTLTARDPRRRAASHPHHPSTRRGGTTRDTAPGRTRAVGRGAP